MKTFNKIYILLAICGLIAGCSKDNAVDNTSISIHKQISVCFDSDSKVQFDESLHTVWTEKDEVSIFNNSTTHERWKFLGKTGDTSGTLELAEIPTVIGTPVNGLIALYPYNINNTRYQNYVYATGHHEFTCEFKDDSTPFVGENILVATASNDTESLKFKSALGFIKLSLTGDEEIESISINGNNNETLSASSLLINSKTLNISASGDEYKTITILCKNVTLSEKEKVFIIPVIPQTFTQGFTVTIHPRNNDTTIKSTAKEINVQQNHIIPMDEVAINRIPYVQFNNETQGTFSISGEQPQGSLFEISTGIDNWETLEFNKEYEFGGNKGSIRLRGKSPLGTGECNISFTGEGEVRCYGNINTLVDYENYKNANTETAIYRNLFKGCKTLINSPELPATTLADHCYHSMFNGCTSLTSAPELPATTLADQCYSNMFNSCTSITSAPELPATTLAYGCYGAMFARCESLVITPKILPATILTGSCYNSMFYMCTSLTKAPELPATTLADQCYYCMLQKCTSLTTAPALPATTLAQDCYKVMFDGCTSLTAAPELPATTLAQECYRGMFQNCTSLTAAPELPATTLADSCYKYMFSQCTSLVEAPELPATTLAKSCYEYMFWTCSSLKNVPKILPATTLTELCYHHMFSHTSILQTPELPATTLAEKCYSYMFYDCQSLVNGPEILPTTAMADYCCDHMFTGCTSLTSAPELPATTLADHCYYYMFSGCQSLVKGPKILPATAMADYCCDHMFTGCTSLTSAPELPATTLTKSCYAYMFSGCTSLTTAPELPATTLAELCYYFMFYGCTSLTTAPKLPATTLTNSCYDSMFYGCQSLSKVSVKFTNWSWGLPTYEWLNGVSPNGIFECQSNLDIIRGTWFIPTGWIVNLNDSPQENESLEKFDEKEEQSW